MRYPVVFLLAVFMTISFGKIHADVVVGGSRPVTVYVPPSFDPCLPIPVIIMIHGYTGSGVQMENYYKIKPLADAWGFLYATPDGTVNAACQRFWNATDSSTCPSDPKPDDSSYLSSIIDEIKALFPNVDRDRICCCGCSMGGFMSYRMACDHADQVTAIASHAGATFKNPADCTPSEPVHVLEIHGTADDVIFYNGGINTLTNVEYPGPVETIQIWAGYNHCAGELQAVGGINMDFISEITGPETTVMSYLDRCDPGGSAELWTMDQTGHFPSDLVVKDFPYTTELAFQMFHWLLSHPRRKSPVALFQVTPHEGPPPLEVIFDASASTAPEGTTISSNRWDFGDGTRGEGAIVSHVYNQPGRWISQLRVTTEDIRVSLPSTSVIRVSCPPGDTFPWQAADIGQPSFPGSAWKDGECVSLCAGGSLLIGMSDRLHFVWQETSGDFVSTARIEEIEGAPSAQIGLMARIGTDSNEVMAAMGIVRTPTAYTFRFCSRKTAGGSIVIRAGQKAEVPAWVKIQRRGDDLIGFSLIDNLTWNEVGRMTLKESPEKFLVGIFGLGQEPTGDSSFQALQARVFPSIAPDCNGNGFDDAVDIANGTSMDCNGNGIPDSCDIASGASQDMNLNGIPDDCDDRFLRGDANADGRTDISDGVAILNYLFLGGTNVPCEQAGDVNDDGLLDISDGIYVLNFLFTGGKAIEPPVGECGIDPTGHDLPCDEFPICE